MINKLAIILWLILLTIFININNVYINNNIFYSPDESANYSVTKEYWTNWNMYLEWEYLEYDKWNILHQRWFFTYNDKIVPFNFLWIPFFYWPLYSILWDNIKYINSIFLLIIIISIYSLSSLIKIIDKKNSWLVILWLLGTMPLLYFLNFPFFNIVPVIPFSILFVFYLIKFNKTENIKFLYLSIFFSLIIIWFRYNYIIFIFLFILINIIKNLNIYKNIKAKSLHLFILFILGIIVFFIPLIILNKTLYWDYLMYWYSLFNKIIFAEERSWSVIQSIINIFFSSQNFDLNLLLTNLKNNFFIISPIFYLLWFIPLIHKKLSSSIWLYWIIILYIILYMWTSNTYGSWMENIIIWNSINRYWIILHLFFILPIIYFLNHKWNKLVKIILVFYIFISLPILANELVIKNKKLINLYSNIEDIKDRKIDYMISPMVDKVFFNDYKQITRFCWVECRKEFDRIKFDMVNTLRFLLKNWENIYVYKSTYFNEEYHFEELSKMWIQFIRIKWDFYKLYLKKYND